MNEQNQQGSQEFVTALLMVVSFILFLITLITEIKAHVVLSDMAQLLIVMVTVSVVPALGRYLHNWMLAVHEEDREKQVLLRAGRTKTAFIAAVTVILVLGAWLCVRAFSHS